MATQTRNPTSDEAASGSLSGSAGARYTLVDDHPDTGGADVLIFGTTAASITFGYSAFAIPQGSTSISVQVLYYDGEAANGANNCAGRLKIGTQYFNASTHNPSGTTYTSRSDNWATNPATSAAWTVDQINGVGANALAAFGIGSTDSNPAFRVSSVQLQVTYTEPPARTGSGSGSASTATGSGTGTVSISGSGSGSATTATGSGAGAVSITGSGSGAASTPTASGTGTVSDASRTGEGAGTASNATASGSGTVSISGSGSATASAQTASGSGAMAVSGYGSGAASAQAATGTGAVLITGSGSGTASNATGSGSGTVEQPVTSRTGSGAGTASNATGSGTGSVAITGSGSGSSSSATASGSGSVVVPSPPRRRATGHSMSRVTRTRSPRFTRVRRLK